MGQLWSSLQTWLATDFVAESTHSSSDWLLMSLETIEDGQPTTIEEKNLYDFPHLYFLPSTMVLVDFGS